MTGTPHLNGWKEIAQYLGKSVRSVQRWEAELGLPVHRVDTGPGQTVYARPEELDTWLASRDPVTESSAPPAETAVTPDLADPTPADAVRQGHWRVAALAVGIAAVALAAFLLRPDASDAATAIRVIVTGSSVRAYSAADRLVWEHDLGRSVSQVEGVDVLHVDVDGDAVEEVVVPVRFAPGGSRVADRSDALMCFDADGTVRWSVPLDMTVRFGQGDFSGPWQIEAVAAGGTPGPRAIWVAFGHHTWWPSVVLEVAPDGRSRVRYVQAGRVRALAEWATPAGRFLVAGGVSNAHARGTVALLPLPSPGGAFGETYRSPEATGSRYECLSCDGLAPLRYWVLPPSELATANGDANFFVDHLTRQGDALRATTNSTSGYHILTIGPDLVPTSFAASDKFAILHRELETRGRLTHTVTECTAHAGPVALEVFAAGRWARESLNTN